MRVGTLAMDLIKGVPSQAPAVVFQLLLFPAFGISAVAVHLLQSGTWFTLLSAGSLRTSRAASQPEPGI